MIMKKWKWTIGGAFGERTPEENYFSTHDKTGMDKWLTIWIDKVFFTYFTFLWMTDEQATRVTEEKALAFPRIISLTKK